MMKYGKKSREVISQSESFELEPHQMKAYGFQMNKKKIASGSWSVEQNKIYLQFLLQNEQDFQTQLLRRKNRVFYRISKLLKKRTPDQCRSHHQKLLIKHKGSLLNVIKELQSKTCNEIDLEIKENKDFQQKKTRPCTVELINEVKIKENKDEFLQKQEFGWFSMGIKENFLQLNINVEFIKQW